MPVILIMDCRLSKNCALNDADFADCRPESHAVVATWLYLRPLDPRGRRIYRLPRPSDWAKSGGQANSSLCLV
jgi:hypothetical protein